MRVRACECDQKCACNNCSDGSDSSNSPSGGLVQQQQNGLAASPLPSQLAINHRTRQRVCVCAGESEIERRVFRRACVHAPITGKSPDQANAPNICHRSHPLPAHRMKHGDSHARIDAMNSHNNPTVHVVRACDRATTWPTLRGAFRRSYGFTVIPCFPFPQFTHHHIQSHTKSELNIFSAHTSRGGYFRSFASACVYLRVPIVGSSAPILAHHHRCGLIDLCRTGGVGDARHASAAKECALARIVRPINNNFASTLSLHRASHQCIDYRSQHIDFRCFASRLPITIDWESIALHCAIFRPVLNKCIDKQPNNRIASITWESIELPASQSQSHNKCMNNGALLATLPAVRVRLK